MDCLAFILLSDWENQNLYTEHAINCILDFFPYHDIRGRNIFIRSWHP